MDDRVLGRTGLNVSCLCLGTVNFADPTPEPEAADIPIDKTLRALDYLVRQGKIRYIGCSTHPAWAVMEAIMVSELKGYVRLVSEPPTYDLLDRRIENELIPLCQAHGLGLMTWAPMAMDVLVGRYSDANQYPDNSRAALRGGFYADCVTEGAIEVGRTFQFWPRKLA